MLLIKICVIKNTNSYHEHEMKKKFQLHILFVEGVGETSDGCCKTSLRMAKLNKKNKYFKLLCDFG